MILGLVHVVLISMLCLFCENVGFVVLVCHSAWCRYKIFKLLDKLSYVSKKNLERLRVNMHIYIMHYRCPSYHRNRDIALSSCHNIVLQSGYLVISIIIK